MKALLLNVFIFSTLITFSQKGIMQEQSEYFAKKNISAEEYYSINKPAKINKDKSSQTCNLNKMVFGWHPYWENGLEANYDWNLISDFCYFSYELNASTGEANTTHSFETTSSVTTALNNGVNVHLCVTLFSDHQTFLESSSARQTLIDNLIDLLNNRGAIGVNIDFEGIPSSQRDNFTDFMIQLSNALHQNIPGSIVSFDLYAVDWNNVYDVAAMANYVDYFMIMGYDYYWTGSANAGPNSPLYSMTSSYDYNLSKTITYYLDKGAPANKLVMGIPYYGRDWPTDDNSVPASTSGNGSSKFYNVIKDNADGYYSTPLWEPNSFTTYYAYTVNGQWHECFTDDERTLPYRYDLFNRRGLAGIGIWALGYDDGYTELWDVISDKLTDCATTPCTDTIYDMGGPGQNYYNNEDYTYTIAPSGAAGLSLNFTQFDLEDNYDSLWIFDGSSENAPLIGGWSGTAGPGNIVASGNALTIKFHSDGATTNAGFTAIWQCSTDNVPPTTSINTNQWETSDFDVSFTDYDNNSLLHSFYLVEQNNGTNWSANKVKGYFFDDFSSSSQWTFSEGNWQIISGELNQNDETNSNTNAYCSFLQTSQNVYLYKWKMKISGTGTNRRAGIYIFSDDATSTQRGNAYMIYFRVDNNKCQIYKSENDAIDIKTDDACNVDEDTWYDYAVLYNPANGTIKAYQNNVLVSQWQDPSPLQSGNYLSFRTGECNVFYDDFAVLKSRGNTVTVNVGLGSQDDVQYQNSSPSNPACKIVSVVCDQAYNLSNTAENTVNIDRTPPANITYVNDGDGYDIDTISNYLNLSANWQASNDANSGIAEYIFAIGTTAGDSDLVDWTSCGNNNHFSTQPTNIQSNTVYYISVKARNNAGLYSSVSTSDGVLISDTTLSTDKLTTKEKIILFPNPASNYVVIENVTNHKKIEIFNYLGEKILSEKISSDKHKINTSGLKTGIYIVKIDEMSFKLIIKR